jgi:glycyl-tRNA synthetase beta chain
MKDLLLEIGTEEIPASFLAPAVKTLQEQFCAFLKAKRIGFGSVKSFYTPRRLAILISNVSEMQKEETLEVQGPPRKFAFDEQGRPTKVAVGFANSHKLKTSDIYFKQTQKGEYVFIKKKSEIKTIEQLLKENLSGLIPGLQFPKTMRWEAEKIRFARPIRWITLIYGTKPVLANVAGLKSSGFTQGHRNNARKKISIPNIKKYKETLKKYDVLVDAEDRKTYIKKQLHILSQKVKGKIVEDEELINEATNICEMPNPILCEFRPEFLNLPAPVLITALKTHTRSFAVQNMPQRHRDTEKNQRKDLTLEHSENTGNPVSSATNLLPYFIAITNTPKCDVKQVRYWYEQAVESRLDDAKFFYDEDVKFGLVNRVEEEKKVVWIEGLGTLFDKTARLEKLVVVLSQRIANVNNNLLLKSAFLSKADLLTNMVREKEYTSLQGIMGGIYVQAAGEHELVAKIIAEHYLPKSADDKLPETPEGSILSIADKIDNIVGAFIVNAVPSGSNDPFGLRRQAMAIGAICLKRQFYINLSEIIDLSFDYFDVAQNDKLLQTIKLFFIERLNALLLDKKITYDTTNAVLAVSGINPLDAFERAVVLSEFRKQPEFEPLVVGQKRVNNILKGIAESFFVREDLLIEPNEQILFNQAKALETSLNFEVSKRNYKKGLELLLTLRPAIDGFFDKVLVMTEDENYKNNRIGLLQYVKSLFMKIADLSEIVI